MDDLVELLKRRWLSHWPKHSSEYFNEYCFTDSYVFYFVRNNADHRKEFHSGEWKTNEDSLAIKWTKTDKTKFSRFIISRGDFGEIFNLKLEMAEDSRNDGEKTLYYSREE